MKNIFVDCGGNKGQSVDMFLRSKDYRNKKDCTIFSFEPIERVAKEYCNRPEIIFFNKAVWIFDGYINMYVDKSSSGQGSSLIKEKINKKIDSINPVFVPCIDFSKWIKNSFSADDYIVIKMDIEGAEYEVLNKMIEDQTINYIKKLFVEWHYNKIKMPKQKHLEFIEKLESVAKFPIFIWK